jgi:hypothetical protein
LAAVPGFALVMSCVALYLPHGVDVRLLEDGDVRRAALVKDGPNAEQLADDWWTAAARLRWRAHSAAVEITSRSQRHTGKGEDP